MYGSQEEKKKCCDVGEQKFFILRLQEKQNCVHFAQKLLKFKSKEEKESFLSKTSMFSIWRKVYLL